MMLKHGDLSILDTPEGYHRWFNDPELWGAAVRQVCTQLGLACDAIRPGVPGTFPTFIVDERWVLKFFGPLFDGRISLEVEEKIGQLTWDAGLPAPEVLRPGRLGGCAPGWQYLVMRFIPGCSYGEVFNQVSPADRMHLAAWLGERLAEFHRLPLPLTPSAIFEVRPARVARRLRAWFEARQAQADLGLPPHLALHAQAFLQAVDLLPPVQPALHLVHADVTRDHVLGSFSAGGWQPHALIDFGDCMSGDLYYELVALHLDLFDCDSTLLHVFLRAYSGSSAPPGRSPQADPHFSRRCLAAALQHQFNVFGVVFQRHPELDALQSLDALADTLWKKGCHL